MQPLVGRVNRRVLMRIVRFRRSTKRVEMWVAAGFSGPLAARFRCHARSMTRAQRFRAAARRRFRDRRHPIAAGQRRVELHVEGTLIRFPQ
jgi:hypothetical protein